MAVSQERPRGRAVTWGFFPPGGQEQGTVGCELSSSLRGHFPLSVAFSSFRARPLGAKKAAETSPVWITDAQEGWVKERMRGSQRALWGWKVRAGSEGVLLSVTCLPRAGEMGSSAPGIRRVQLGDALMVAWL